MEIVITDGYSLNPGDLDWKQLEQLGKLTIYERTDPVTLMDRCFDADIILTNKTVITKELIDTASRLKLIAVTATGYNNVDVAAASAKGITVCNVPSYGTFSVAQHAFALLLELINHVGLNGASVAGGDWSKAKDWCYTIKPIVELKDKVIGIVGLGKIGKQMAVIARAFGMKVIYFGGREVISDAMQVDLPQLFIQADVISLHCPLTKDNAGFVNRELLELMKPTSILINTARGALINEKDLAQALQQGRIAGAGLDVLSDEPPSKDHPLIGLENCIITPHNAWISFEARQRIMNVSIANVQSFLNGKPQNVVV